MLKTFRNGCLVGLITSCLTGCIIVTEQYDRPINDQQQTNVKCQKMYTHYDIDRMNAREKQQARSELKKFDEHLQSIIHMIDYWSIKDYTK